MKPPDRFHLNQPFQLFYTVGVFSLEFSLTIRENDIVLIDFEARFYLLLCQQIAQKLTGRMQATCGGWFLQIWWLLK